MIEFSQLWLSVLMNVSLKAVIISLLAAALLRMLKSTDAGFQHRLWTSIMAAMLLMPGLTFCLPILSVRLLPPENPQDLSLVQLLCLDPFRESKTPAEPLTHPTLSPSSTRQEHSPFGVAGIPSEISNPDGRSPTISTLNKSQVMAEYIPKHGLWPLLAVTIWASGALFFLTKLISGLIGTISLHRSSSAIMPEELIESGIDHESSLMSPCQRLRMAECPSLTVPVVIGTIRPMILLPPEWVTWTPEKLQDVLMHESTHMQRLDPLITLITQLNRCVHWFNPLAWWLQQRIAVLAEQPCDDAAIEAANGDRHRYARHLLEIAEHAMQQKGRFSRAAISMAEHGRVESRISLILDGTRPLTKQITWSSSLSLTVLAVVLTAVTASIQVTHAESSDSESILDKTPESLSLEKPDGTVANFPEAKKDIPQADPALTTPEPLLTPDTVVARVNGIPILLRDVLPSLVSDAVLLKYTPTVLQVSFTRGLRDHLPQYVIDEIVVQGFSKSISEEKQRQIRSSFEPQFQILVAKIRQDRKLTTDDELNEELTSQGSSMDFLRQQFIKQQIVNRYVSSLTEHLPPQPEDLLKYYNDHGTEYSLSERIHVSEIVVRFSNHGGSDGARLIMNRILDELKEGKDFSVLASSGSDNHSARFGGDLGWINRGSLTDKTLEDTLFLLKEGETTDLIERDDKFELYKVWKREAARTTSFEEAADSIHHKLSNEALGKAREKVLNDLRSQAVVETLFDSNWNSDPAMKSADTSK